MADSNAPSLTFDTWQLALDGGEFEPTLVALKEVVAHLELGNMHLEDAVRCYELGTLLSRRCEQLLDQAELRIARLDEIDESNEQDI